MGNEEPMLVEKKGDKKEAPKVIDSDEKKVE